MTPNAATRRRRRRSVRGAAVAVAVGLRAASLLLPPPLDVASAARHAGTGGGGHGGEEDLYAVLGVPTHAPVREIKSAYRRKARDTHPDKNVGVPPEESAAAFREVVHAFEVLSDARSRGRYDRTSGEGRGDDGDGGSGRSSRRQRGPPRAARGRDRPEVKAARDRVLHLASLEQLRTIMLDDDGRLERHLLLCFFTPALEGVVNDELLYPYPFAGMSPQHIWWEDLLQTASVRFRRSNDLTRYFDVGSGDGMTDPAFVFLRKGARLGDAFQYDGADAFVHRTSERSSFETWMWARVEVRVVFVNGHDRPAEIYWIDGTSANIVRETLDPGASWVHYSRLTHEFYARDVRVDAWEGSPGGWKLTANSSLGSWRVGVEEGGSPPVRADGSVHVEIPRRGCMDLSGHCGFWAGQDQCRMNPTFMRDKCALTCGHCGDDPREEQTCESDQTCKN